MKSYLKYFLTIAVLCSGLYSSGQTKTASYAFLLGTDTVGYEQYTRTTDRIEGDIITFAPSVTTVHFQVMLNTDGMITLFNYSSANPVSGKKMIERSIVIQNDSIHQRLSFSGKVDSFFTRSFAALPGSIPHFDYDVSMYEQMIMELIKTGKDSIPIDKLSNTASHNFIRRSGINEYQTKYFFYPVILKTNASNDIVSLDATASTVKIIAVKTAPFSFASLVNQRVQVENTKGASGNYSPGDTIRVSVKGSDLQVTYGRPYRRGRVIFGDIVPWNKVWRTGANFATHFSTTKDLLFGTFLLPAGRYTLWTLPDPSGAKLIINKGVNIFGTQYNPRNDLVRLDMEKMVLPKMIEQFTIDITETANGGKLKFSWETTAYSIEFSVNK